MALQRSSSQMRFAIGLLIGLAAPLGFAELVAHLQPRGELRAYVDDSSLTGVYKPDPVLGADYRSYADFEKENAAALAKLGALDQQRPTWLFLGNSFVQAEGMLAATATAALPDKRIFYLGRNEPLPLRVAQVRLLLAQGLRPERVVFVLLPIDFTVLGAQPLSSIKVTPGGALTNHLRLPPGAAGALVRTSRLAQLAWIRSGKHVQNPEFRGRQLMEKVSPALAGDMRTLLVTLRDTSSAADAKLTVLLLPNREQIFGSGGFALQDTLLRICAEEQIDCLDARDFLRGEPDPTAFFLPDWHFTRSGNEILLRTLLKHFAREGQSP